MIFDTENWQPMWTSVKVKWKNHISFTDFFLEKSSPCWLTSTKFLHWGCTVPVLPSLLHRACKKVIGPNQLQKHSARPRSVAVQNCLYLLQNLSLLNWYLRYWSRIVWHFFLTYRRVSTSAVLSVLVQRDCPNISRGSKSSKLKKKIYP